MALYKRGNQIIYGNKGGFISPGGYDKIVIEHQYPISRKEVGI